MTEKPRPAVDDHDIISLPFIFVPDGAPMPDVSRIFRDPIILRARFERAENAAPQSAPHSVSGGIYSETAPPSTLLVAGTTRNRDQGLPPNPLPSQGQASTYTDHLDDQVTASGRKYHHEGYSAALLPRSRRNAVLWGTWLRLTYHGRSVVVEVTDWGAGNRQENRVLDLSKAAMAFLLGVTTDRITDRTAGVIQLELIEIVPRDTPLGPWLPSR